MTDHTFKIPTPAKLERFAEILSQAFSPAVPDALAWIQGVGRENNRVLIEGGEVVGGLVRYGMGQWFGGKSVPMVGIAGVATAPAKRGQGIATRVMEAALAEAADDGFALATLYPATQGIYRRVGFERAGSRFEIRVPTYLLGFAERSLLLRPEEAGDVERIQALHRRHGSRNPGTPDRGDILWHRLRNPRGGQAPRCYLVEDERGDAAGYCFLSSREKEHGRQELLVSDFVAESRPAALRLLSFLGDHASLAEEIVLYGSAEHPLLALLPEQRHRVSLTDVWMLRILDVKRALEGRGFPADVSTRLEMEITDDLLPANRGRFVLDVSEGGAQVQAGGTGRLRIHIRGLAALYTGHLSPSDLALLGLLEGEPQDLARAATLFAGPPPAMSDFF